MNPKVKICGLFREVDIKYVNLIKPDYIGFILDFPKSHRNLTFEQAQALKEKLNPDIKAVGVFVNKTFDYIEQYIKHSVIDIIQLHGDEDESYIRALRSKFPNTEIWKAFKIKDKSDVAKAQASSADYIIFDNGYGTGKCFDWSLVTGLNRDIILAGGLKPENIQSAIQTIKPWGIDVSSGVEIDKVKDKTKIQLLINNTRL